ncbi:hypothetical protein GCM10010505_58340 [Kitasatospora aburaviensis]
MHGVEGEGAGGGLVTVLGEAVQDVRRNDRAERRFSGHVAKSEASVTCCHRRGRNRAPSQGIARRLKEWNVRPARFGGALRSVTLEHIMRNGLLLLSCRVEGL